MAKFAIVLGPVSGPTNSFQPNPIAGQEETPETVRSCRPDMDGDFGIWLGEFTLQM